jgi:hypothetical protein
VNRLIDEEYDYGKIEREYARTPEEVLADRIEDEEFKLRRDFCADNLVEAICESSTQDQQSLWEAFNEDDAIYMRSIIRDMRDSWISSVARFRADR